MCSLWSIQMWVNESPHLCLYLLLIPEIFVPLMQTWGSIKTLQGFELISDFLRSLHSCVIGLFASESRNTCKQVNLSNFTTLKHIFLHLIPRPMQWRSMSLLIQTLIWLAFPRLNLWPSLGSLHHTQFSPSLFPKHVTVDTSCGYARLCGYVTHLALQKRNTHKHAHTHTLTWRQQARFGDFDHLICHFLKRRAEVPRPWSNLRKINRDLRVSFSLFILNGRHGNLS